MLKILISVPLDTSVIYMGWDDSEADGIKLIPQPCLFSRTTFFPRCKYFNKEGTSVFTGKKTQTQPRFF